MKLKSRIAVEPRFEMSSMTDLVFLLLIFFMLITTIIVPNVNALKLVLPSSKEADKTKDIKISIAIDENRKFYVGSAPVAFDQIAGTVAAQVKGQQNAVVILHTHYSVPIEDVVRVMDIAKQMKLKMVLATHPEK